MQASVDINSNSEITARIYWTSIGAFGIRFDSGGNAFFYQDGGADLIDLGAHSTSLKEGITTDNFAGEIITIEKSNIGEVRMFVGEDKNPLPYIGGFWFSWLAVHADTELYK